jgi:phosphoribosylglycinamide formyltransferase 1
LPIPAALEGRVLNIHPALLPRFGGPGMYGHHVHEAVLAAARSEGLTQSGCTVHLCNNEYDKGQILLQRTCPILQGDTPDSLAARVFEQELVAYPQAIRDLIASQSLDAVHP